MAEANVVEGLSIIEEGESKPFCVGCAYGKAHRQPFSAGRQKAGQTGELVYSDLCGPMSCPSPGGAKYFIIFKDDHSGYVTINFIKNKSEAFHCFKHYAERLEVEIGKRVNTLSLGDSGLTMEENSSTQISQRGQKRKGFDKKVVRRIHRSGTAWLSD